MMLRAILIAVALLVAQQVALAHPLKHVGGDASPQDPASELCKLHAALGTVLGAVSGAQPAQPLCSLEQARFVFAARAAPSLAAPLPASRGPPPASLK